MRATSMGILLAVASASLFLWWVPLEAASKPSSLAPLEQAKAFIQAEEFEQAVGVLKGVPLEDRAVAARVDLLLGRIYLAIGKPAKALDFFEAASFASLQDEATAYLGLAEASPGGSLPGDAAAGGVAVLDDPAAPPSPVRAVTVPPPPPPPLPTDHLAMAERRLPVSYSSIKEIWGRRRMHSTAPAWLM